MTYQEAKKARKAYEKNVNVALYEDKRKQIEEREKEIMKALNDTAGSIPVVDEVEEEEELEEEIESDEISSTQLLAEQMVSKVWISPKPVFSSQNLAFSSPPPPLATHYFRPQKFRS